MANKKIIPLSGKHGIGRFAKVDSEDYEYLMQFIWCCTKHRNTFYARETKHRKSATMHRVIMGVTDPNITIDHRDRDGLNNQRDNLRICTSSQNSINKKKRRDYTHSGYRGVKRRKNCPYWEARITINKKRISLGFFINEKDAAFAFNEASKLRHGEFANLNILPKNYKPLPKITKKKMSKYRGVGPNKNSTGFRSRININGREISLGEFDTEDEAALSYNKKAIQLFGKNAKINIIGE